MAVEIQKPEIKKYLYPKQLKQRKDLSLFATLGFLGYSLISPDMYILPSLFALGSLMYHRHILKKYEKSRIGYGGKVYYKIGKDEIGRDVEITDFYFHRHMLVVGGTGMGKTSLYRIILRQLMKKNFGIIYINFKAEDTDFFNLYSLAKECGVAEDLLLLNFAPSSQITKETARYSPLKSLETPQEIADFFFNLLAPASGDMEYWQGRGRNLMSAAARVFVYMRDIEKRPPKLKLLIDSFEVNNMVEVIKSANCPDEWKRWIEVYLQDIDPSGRLRKGDMKAFTPEMQNQHGYAIQQWKEALMDIALRYSHIFDSEYSDVDFKEVLRNSRLLYVHMPALALPDKTKEALGRLILAGLKTATSAMLGERLLGDIDELKSMKKKEKPKNPFLILIDEHGTAPITGLDDFIRQIRSLGGGAIIADQNWDGIKQKFGDAYLNTLLGNSLTKIIMNVEGSEAVMKYLEARIPKKKAILPQYEYEDTFLQTAKNTHLQEEPILKTDKVVELTAGEGFVIQKENILKCKFDFYEPPPEKYIDIFVYERERIKYSEKIQQILQQHEDVEKQCEEFIRIETKGITVESEEEEEEDNKPLEYFKYIEDYLVNNQKVDAYELFIDMVQKFGEENDYVVKAAKKILYWELSQYSPDVINSMTLGLTLQEYIEKITNAVEQVKQYYLCLNIQKERENENERSDKNQSQGK